MKPVPIAAVLVALAASSAPATAQSLTPAAEIFGGYSLLPADGDDFPRGTSHGVQSSVTVNLNRWLGIVADAGAHFDTATIVYEPRTPGVEARTRVIELMVGPRFSARLDRVTPFAHGLVGIVSGDAGDNFRGFSDTRLGFGGGGGVDIQLHDRLALRAQFDLLASFADIFEANTRMATGIVVRFGGR